MCCRGCSDEGVVCATTGHKMLRQTQDKILIASSIHAQEWFDKACT